MLVRALLTDSLLLMDFATRPSDRLALAFGWYNESNDRLAGLGRTAAKVGLPRANEWPDAVKRRRSEIEVAMRARGIPKLKRLDDEKRLAEKHGRIREYWDYRFLSEVIHRPDVSQAHRTRRPEKGIVQLYMRTSDREWRAAALTGAMTSALHAHKAVSSMFGWTETRPEEIDQLLDALDHLFPNAKR